MKDENNQNLFETVFQGVEPPKDTNMIDESVNSLNGQMTTPTPEAPVTTEPVAQSVSQPVATPQVNGMEQPTVMNSSPNPVPVQETVPPVEQATPTNPAVLQPENVVQSNVSGPVSAEIPATMNAEPVASSVSQTVATPQVNGMDQSTVMNSSPNPVPVQETVPPVEQATPTNPAVLQPENVVQPNVSESVSTETPSTPQPEPVATPSPTNSVDDKKLNPLVRLVVYLLLIVAVLFSLYNLVVVPIMKTAAEKDIENKRLKKVEDYLKDVEVSFQANSDLQEMETCEIVSSGEYCTTDEDVIDESRALKIQSKQTVEGGMLFFKDGMVYSGYVYLEGHTYSIQDGVVKEKVIEETPEEEEK